MQEKLGVQPEKARLSDILVTVLVSLVLGVIYHFWGSVYNLLKPLFFEADELLYGMWFAATLAYLLIRKPGVAIIGRRPTWKCCLAGWGLTLLLYGLIQGLGAELVFAAFRYRSTSAWTLAIAGAGATIGSMIMDFYYSYTDDLQTWMFLAKYGMRVLSGAVIAGLLMLLLAKALDRTGVTSLRVLRRRRITKHWMIRAMSNATVSLVPAQSAEMVPEPAVYVEGLRLKYPGEERLMFKDPPSRLSEGRRCSLGPSGAANPRRRCLAG